MTTQADAARGALLLALRGAGIRDLDVLRAMEAVPREEFLPLSLRDLGWRNMALPIACGQTMLPPVSLAMMLEALALRPEHRVLEIGTGTGYATAVLARLADEIVSFERYRTMAEDAQERLKRLGVAVRIVAGDGLTVSSEFGRFNRIIVHAALTAVPGRLSDALETGGRIVTGIPAKDGQPGALAVYERSDNGFSARYLASLPLAPVQLGVALAL